MKNQWIRILIAGIAVEVLFLPFILFVNSVFGIGVYSALGMLFLFAFLFAGGYWAEITYKSASKAVLNGAMVGVATIILWIVLVIIVMSLDLGVGKKPDSRTLMLLANFIKIPGGALGGYTAFKMKK